MKKLFAVLAILAISTSSYAAAEKKKVCHEDVKTKKQVCKEIKVHKKLEATPVPQKKK